MYRTFVIKTQTIFEYGRGQCVLCKNVILDSECNKENYQYTSYLKRRRFFGPV